MSVRWIVISTLFVAGCESADPKLIPDEYLQSELGLTLEDRVHTIELYGGLNERADPDSISVRQGDFVQLVSSDWLIHEVDFNETTSLRREFLTRTGQSASPPLLEKGSRFVLSFADAPPGRYPFALAGNGGPGSGVIVVLDPEAG